jgi:serine/threonine-protein kinase
VYCPQDGVALVLVEGLRPGTIIQRKYRITEQIGSGGMGVVYRAHHILLKEDYALKLINAQYAGDPHVVQRFLAEALMANRIRHMNVVRVEDADETEDGQPFVVMEYAAGTSLRQIIRPDHIHEPLPLDPQRAVNIACQVLAGLAAAHQMKIVHRDIKPDNILLRTLEDGQEQVKIIDFGIAKAKEKLVDTRVSTQPGMFIGTPQYSAPEQASGSGQIDERTDIYAVGVVLYEMLSGRPPFTGDAQEILEQHKLAVPPPFQLVCPNLDTAKLIQVVMRALSKKPAARYSTAEEMISALKLTRLSRARLADEYEISQTPRAPGSVRKRTLTLIVLSVILIGVGFLTYHWLGKQSGSTADQELAPRVDQIREKLATARRAREGGSYDEAILIYREVSAIEPDDPEAKAGLEASENLKEAEESFANGEYANAVAAFQSVLKIYPEDSRVQTRILDALNAQKDEERIFNKKD